MSNDSNKEFASAVALSIKNISDTWEQIRSMQSEMRLLMERSFSDNGLIPKNNSLIYNYISTKNDAHDAISTKEVLKLNLQAQHPEPMVLPCPESIIT